MFIILGLYCRIWNLFLRLPAPPVRSPCNPTNTEVVQLSNNAVGAIWFIPMGSNQKQRCGSEFVKWHDINTPEEYADEWRQNNADLKLLCLVSSCSASWWRPLHWIICHSLLTSTQFHSLVQWWHPRGIWPQRTRLSQSQNSAMGTWPMRSGAHCGVLWLTEASSLRPNSPRMSPLDETVKLCRRQKTVANYPVQWPSPWCRTWWNQTQ